MSEPSSFNTENSSPTWTRHKGLIAFVVVLLIALAGVFDRFKDLSDLEKQWIGQFLRCQDGPGVSSPVSDSR